MSEKDGDWRLEDCWIQCRCYFPAQRSINVLHRRSPQILSMIERKLRAKDEFESQIMQANVVLRGEGLVIDCPRYLQRLEKLQPVQC